jgi:hypothetical protein
VEVVVARARHRRLSRDVILDARGRERLVAVHPQHRPRRVRAAGSELKLEPFEQRPALAKLRGVLVDRSELTVLVVVSLENGQPAPGARAKIELGQRAVVLLDGRDILLILRDDVVPPERVEVSSDN